MHLANLNVITDAGRSLSVIINTDLDILLQEISPTWAPQLFFLHPISVSKVIILAYLSLRQPLPLSGS